MFDQINFIDQEICQSDQIYLMESRLNCCLVSTSLNNKNVFMGYGYEYWIEPDTTESR